MAKPNTTYVPQEKLLALVEAAGLVAQRQAGFYKVVGPHGPNGPRLYVASTKKVGRVDLSGFEVEFGANGLGGQSFGAVKQQLDMSLPEEDIINNFAALLEHMKALPKPEPKARAAKPAEVTVEGTAPAEEDPRKARLAHLETVLRIASSRPGIEVSPEMRAEHDQLVEELTAPAAESEPLGQPQE